MLLFTSRFIVFKPVYHVISFFPVRLPVPLVFVSVCPYLLLFWHSSNGRASSRSFCHPGDKRNSFSPREEEDRLPPAYQVERVPHRRLTSRRNRSKDEKQTERTGPRFQFERVERRRAKSRPRKMHKPFSSLAPAVVLDSLAWQCPI